MSKITSLIGASLYRGPNEKLGTFSNQFLKQISGANRLDLITVTFLNLIYPFKTTNNVLSITSGAGTFSATIATNRFFQDGTDFATYLTGLFTTAGSTVTATYDQNSNRLTLAGGGDGAFTISSASSAIYKLGFGYNTDNDTSSTSHVALWNLNLLGTSVVYLGIDIAANSSLAPVDQGAQTGSSVDGADGGDVYNIVGVIPITVDYGGVVSWNNSFNEVRLDPRSQNFGGVRVYLYDDDFERLDNVLDPSAKVNILWHVGYGQ